ncbi:hypothetical protein OROHE_007110 [Orobanche hederae]
MDSSLSSPNKKLQLSTNKRRIGADPADARPEKKIVTTPSSKRKCAAKVKGDLLGKNDRTNMHIDRILGSYTQRQRNEFKDFMKPDDAKFDTRTSLTKLWLVNGKLQPDQKKCVEEMGFSSITKIEFEQLDRELVRWLVDRYNPDESLITLDNPCHINISAVEASRALGIPHKGDDIYLDFDSVEGINKYKNYFTVTSGRIDINELARKLESCVTSGDEFKVCYLMFMFGTLLFPDTLPNIRVGYLNIIVNLEKVPYMNWAKLVVEKLNDGVKLRKEHGRTYLTGCSFLLQVIFFAHIYPKGSTPGVNLTSPLPYVEQLTRERISNITLDFNNAGGYWNPKCYLFYFLRSDIKTKFFAICNIELFSFIYGTKHHLSYSSDNYAESKNLGLVVDLTNSSRYYNSNQLKKDSIKYVKIACKGRDSVPENVAVNKFVYEMPPGA